MTPRRIPSTDLQVSPLCLGTMTFGTPVGEAEAIPIVHRALEMGVNFIDTANMYEGYTRQVGSRGEVSEAILGEALRDRRERAVLATKVGMKIGPSPDDGGLSRAHVLRECDRSLDRLQTDWIDLYYMHTTDPDTPLEESIGAFMDLIEAGKVRCWGISNYDADQTREVLEACDANNWQRPAAHQPPYSLLKRDIEKDLLPLCRAEEIAVVPYQVLQGGLLTGKYRDASSPPEGSRGKEQPGWIPLLNDPAAQKEIADLTEQASEQGLSLFDYTIRTTVETPGITSIILGVKDAGQIEAAVRALE